MRIDLPLPTLGLDQLSDEVRLPAGAVRSAVNVDIDRVGQFKRRLGHTVAAPGAFTGICSFHDLVFVGQGAGLYLLDQTTYALTYLCNMGVEARFDYTTYNGYLYISGPAAHWRFQRGSSTPEPVGAVLPPTLPDVEDSATGTLSPGQYIVAVSLVNAAGEESPAAQLGSFALTAGLRLTNLAVLPDHRWRVYITTTNGAIPYLAEEFTALMSSYTVAVWPDGAPCLTLNLSPLPFGHFIRGWAGRMLVAKDDTLYFSEALRPHLTSLHHNFVQFVGRIRMVEPVTGGVFVADQRGTWFLSGDDLTKYDLKYIDDSLVVPYSGLLVPAEHLPERAGGTGTCAVWLSSSGYKVGTPDGNVIALQPGRIRITSPAVGRSVFLTRDGIKQVITLTAASSATPTGAAIDTATH